MANDIPIACTLGAADLEQRLTEIGEIGADNLISREADGNRHVLRFRAGRESRRRLEEIVAAEAKCCAFLGLSLSERGGELVLSIAAPQGAQMLADQLAEAFTAT